MTVRISVVVCTYNPKDEVLARVLDGILSQDLEAPAWELLVVDNNSSPAIASRSIVKARPVRVSLEPRQGLSAAREHGVKNTTGDVIVFVDDDNIIAPNYLSRVREIFRDPIIGVISGAITPEYQRAPDSWFKDFESMLAIRRPPSEKTYLTNIPLFNEYFPIGAGMAVRRDVIGAYYRSIADRCEYIPGRVGTQLSSSEDIDLDFFAISEGYLVGTAGSLHSRHVIPPVRTTSRYISKLAIAACTSAAVVNRKWAPRFGADVIDSFTVSRRRLRVRLLVAALLSWMPGYRIRYYSTRTLLEVSREENEPRSYAK